MLNPSELDDQIESTKDWVKRAGESLISLYDPKRGVFWHNSVEKKKADDKNTPTSTSRSFYALYEYLRFLREEDEKNQDLSQRVTDVLGGIAKLYFKRLVKDRDKLLMSPDNSVNYFTNSQVLLSASLLRDLSKTLKMESREVSAIRAALRSKALEIEDVLLKKHGCMVKPEEEVHDFVTMYAMRALDAYFGWANVRAYKNEPLICDRIKRDILQQLAFHFSGVSSKFDPSELAFSVALLNRFPTPDASQVTERSIRTIVEFQASDGGFPTARIVTRGLLHVASYEVALTLAGLLIRKLYQSKLSRGDAELCELLLPALQRAYSLIKSHYNELDNTTGWSNDHTRTREPMMESWVTAVVLTFLINYRDALMLFRQYVVLRHYSAKNYRSIPQVEPWPDMTPLFRRPEWVKSTLLSRRAITTDDVKLRKELEDMPLEYISDPTDGSALTRAIKKEIVDPVANSSVHRPTVASLILYGQPGTRKTTLAKRLADSLGWPLLILSPPNFLQKGGLDGVEACAAEIFNDLRRLRRVVVLFDEMEDFFKKRPSDQKLESRTIGAFITAGMLPRLQGLRDDRWVIFLLATNSKIEELDTAVTRLGRFDLRHEMDDPTTRAQVRYVKRSIDLKPGAKLRVLDMKRDQFKKRICDALEMRGHIRDASRVPFSILDDLIKTVVESQKVPTVDEVIEKLSYLLDDKTRFSLIKTRA